jgi:hypothetical protein
MTQLTSGVPRGSSQAAARSRVRRKGRADRDAKRRGQRVGAGVERKTLALLTEHGKAQPLDELAVYIDNWDVDVLLQQVLVVLAAVDADRLDREVGEV